MSGRLPWVAAAVVIVIVAGFAALYLSNPTPGVSTATITLSAPTVSQPAVWTAQGSPLGMWVALTGPAAGADNCAIENIYIVDNWSDIEANAKGDKLGDDLTMGTSDPDDGENDLLDGASDPIITSDGDTATIPYEVPFKIVAAAVLWADSDLRENKGPTGARHVAYVNKDNAYMFLEITSSSGLVNLAITDDDGDGDPDENTQVTGHEYVFENDVPWTQSGNYGGQNDSGLAPYGWAAAPGGLDNVKNTDLPNYVDYARVNFVFTDTESSGGTGEFQLAAGGSMNIAVTLYVWV